MKMIDYSKDIRFKIHRKSEWLREASFRGSDRLHSFTKNVFPLPNPGGECIVKTRHGYSMIVDPSQHMGGLIFRRGSYEEGVLQFLSVVLSKGDTVIDVGANAGLMSLHAASVLEGSGKVVAFEPEENHYASLVKGIQLNSLQNIHAVQLALGSDQEERDMYLQDKQNDGTYTLKEGENKEALFTTKVYTLDGYLGGEDIQSIDWMKVDVEGFELDVLKGSTEFLSSEDAPGCIVEYNKSKELIDFMSDINMYKAYTFYPSKFRPVKLKAYNGEEIPPFENLVFLLPNHLDHINGNIFL